MNKLEALKTYFGHASFRTGQEQIVDSLAAGRESRPVIKSPPCWRKGLPWWSPRSFP